MNGVGVRGNRQGVREERDLECISGSRHNSCRFFSHRTLSPQYGTTMPVPASVSVVHTREPSGLESREVLLLRITQDTTIPVAAHVCIGLENAHELSVLSRAGIIT